MEYWRGRNSGDRQERICIGFRPSQRRSLMIFKTLPSFFHFITRQFQLGHNSSPAHALWSKKLPSAAADTVKVAAGNFHRYYLLLHPPQHSTFLPFNPLRVSSDYKEMMTMKERRRISTEEDVVWFVSLRLSLPATFSGSPLFLPREPCSLNGFSSSQRCHICLHSEPLYEVMERLTKMMGLDHFVKVVVKKVPLWIVFEVSGPFISHLT